MDQVRRVEVEASPVKKRLQLTVYDPQRDVLTNQLALSIPHAPPDGQRKAVRRRFRLYLFNDSGRMARYIQVEMCVRAVFLAYLYHRFPPLLIEPAGRWEVDRLGDAAFRCFLKAERISSATQVDPMI